MCYAVMAKTEGRKGDIAQKKSCLGLIKALSSSDGNGHSLIPPTLAKCLVCTLESCACSSDFLSTYYVQQDSRLWRHSGPHPLTALQSRKEHRCQGVVCEIKQPKRNGVVPQETSGCGELGKPPQGHGVYFIN